MLGRCLKYAAPLDCSPEMRADLSIISHGRTQEVERNRIILACLDGKDIQQVARARNAAAAAGHCSQHLDRRALRSLPAIPYCIGEWKNAPYRPALSRRREKPLLQSALSAGLRKGHLPSRCESLVHDKTARPAESKYRFTSIEILIHIATQRLFSSREGTRRKGPFALYEIREEHFWGLTSGS